MSRWVAGLQVWVKQGDESDEQTIFAELPHGLRLEAGWLICRRLFANDPVHLLPLYPGSCT